MRTVLSVAGRIIVFPLLAAVYTTMGLLALSAVAFVCIVLPIWAIQAL